MSFMQKPKVSHSKLPKNELGLTTREYEGGMSTLCAGCGHDSITAALIQAFWELNIEPYKVVKMSGIGCSSKTTAVFPGGCPRHQRRARPHALRRHRRQCRRARSLLHRRFRRR